MEKYSTKEKSAIADYVQYKLRRAGLTQTKIAKIHGCDPSSVSHAIAQKNPFHVHLGALKNVIANQLSYSSWDELCAEALAHEETAV